MQYISYMFSTQTLLLFILTTLAFAHLPHSPIFVLKKFLNMQQNKLQNIPTSIRKLCNDWTMS